MDALSEPMKYVNTKRIFFVISLVDLSLFIHMIRINILFENYCPWLCMVRFQLQQIINFLLALCVCVCASTVSNIFQTINGRKTNR